MTRLQLDVEEKDERQRDRIRRHSLAACHWLRAVADGSYVDPSSERLLCGNGFVADVWRDLEALRITRSRLTSPERDSAAPWPWDGDQPLTSKTMAMVGREMLTDAGGVDSFLLDWCERDVRSGCKYAAMLLERDPGNFNDAHELYAAGYDRLRELIEPSRRRGERVLEAARTGGFSRAKGPPSAVLSAEVLAIHKQRPHRSWTNVCDLVGQRYGISGRTVRSRTREGRW